MVTYSPSTPGFGNVVNLFLFAQRTDKITWIWMVKIEIIKCRQGRRQGTMTNSFALFKHSHSFLLSEVQSWERYHIQNQNKKLIRTTVWRIFCVVFVFAELSGFAWCYIVKLCDYSKDANPKDLIRHCFFFFLKEFATICW